jgi:beta-lactamase superfamily II metal-dependent hydrolase
MRIRVVADFYEVDLLPVHTSKSGDAIALRYQIGSNWWVHVVDGGYESTAPDLSAHIRKYYNTTTINNVVVTHPDKDHAEGLAPILREFKVETLWMLRPWQYAQALLPHFARYSSVTNLVERLKEEYPYVAQLEEIAASKGIHIREPLQGEFIGPFRVLAPSLPRYLSLVVESDKTPQPSATTNSLLSAVGRLFEPVISFVKAGWGSENFSAEDTSRENEMSVVQYAVLNSQSILLTGDAGREALTEAINYAPSAGISLPGIYRFQVPHHGGRRNLSTEILDRLVGPRLASKRPEGQELFTAVISSAKEDTDHPRKAVLRALIHRGAFIGTTENGAVRFDVGGPARQGWSNMANLSYPDEQEE